MTYGEFVTRQAGVFGFSPFVMRQLLGCLFEDISIIARREGRFEVPKFGVFYRATRKARLITDIDTSLPRWLPAMSSLGFRPAKAVKS